jgi:hypothetical protein
MIVSAYITSLERAAGTEPGQQPADLRRRLVDFLNSLPPAARDRPWSMMEMEKQLSSQGKYISPVLLQLGWKRKRQWSSTGSYHRYWIPPVDPLTRHADNKRI